MSRGRLVAVEGIDGSGTTTLVASLRQRLAGAGHEVHTTREPSDGPVGRLLREMLAGRHQPVDNTTLGLLFAADRADHVQREVEPALAVGKLVLSDRWYHSSLAYQGEGEARAWVRELNRHAPAPDLTLFVEVSPREAARRREGRDDQPEIFDALATQTRVARGYREVIAELQTAGERIDILDGSKSPAEVLEAALAALAT
ncbi:MAG: dTMP kinase [Deltaproteobacteria bacterium]|nr:dTMP kinase [Deltaproteobacteria bacterium]